MIDTTQTHRSTITGICTQVGEAMASQGSLLNGVLSTHGRTQDLSGGNLSLETCPHTSLRQSSSPLPVDSLLLCVTAPSQATQASMTGFLNLVVLV
jgi:hypothetical protein